MCVANYKVLGGGSGLGEKEYRGAQPNELLTFVIWRRPPKDWIPRSTFLIMHGCSTPI